MARDDNDAPSTASATQNASLNAPLQNGTAITHPAPITPSNHTTTDPNPNPNTKLHPTRPPASLLTPPSPLTTRYARQLLLPQLHGLTGQILLSRARVLIIGLGGLGSPAALYLAGAGVGTLGLVDDDVVEQSNLHRQIVHAEERVGWGKVRSASVGIRGLNSGIRVREFEGRVGGRELLGILGEEWVDGECEERDGEGQRGRKGWDVVLDCSDTPATRYAVSDACVLSGMPLVSGAAQRGEGMLLVLNWLWGIEGEEGEERRGPCYRCVFPRPPVPESVKGCSEIGVLGTAVGAVGVLMAQEAIKLVVNRGRIVEGAGTEGKGEMLIFNAFKGLREMWRGVGLMGRRKGCVSCGDDEVLRKMGKVKITRDEVNEGRLDYQAFCGRVEDVRVLREDERISARAFLEEVGRGEGRVIDVREKIEVELGSKVRGAVVVPFSQVMKDAEETFGGEEWQDAVGDGHKTYFVCQRGNDSQIAARRLMEVDKKLGRRRGWVGDVEGGFVAMERLQDGA